MEPRGKPLAIRTFGLTAVSILEDFERVEPFRDKMLIRSDRSNLLLAFALRNPESELSDEQAAEPSLLSLEHRSQRRRSGNV